MEPIWFNLKYILVFVLLLFIVQSWSLLAQLHIVFRHGERAPTNTFPNDQYINYSWPGGWGQLTNKGKLQMFKLGRNMRNEYSNFIPRTYWHKDVNVSSSSSERCLMSAELFCAGLYPPEDFQIWNKDLLWQPVPVYYLPRSQDTNLIMKAACAKYDKMFQEIRVSPVLMEIENKYKSLKEYLSKHSGMVMRNIEDVESLYNTLEIEKLHDFTLPNWVNESIMVTMKELGARNLALYSETEYMKRIKGGSLLRNILNSMAKNLNGVLEPRLFLYAAHDLTLVHVLRTLDLVDTLKPDFGALLIFELYRDGRIKINYRNSWDGVQEIMEPSKCPNPCILNNFEKAFNNVLPVDYNKECALDYNI